MSKRLVVVLVSIGLANVSLSVNASAIGLTHPTGTLLPTGAKLTGTNAGNILLKNENGSSTLGECTTGRLTGELAWNSGISVEWNITTATFSGDGAALVGMNECTGTFGNFTPTTNGGFVDGEAVENGTPWCMRASSGMGADEFQIRGGSCSVPRKLTFVLDVTNPFKPPENFSCKYERTEVMKGTLITDTAGDAIVSLSAGFNTLFAGEAGNNVICPGSLTTQMSFTLETDQSFPQPVYFS